MSPAPPFTTRSLDWEAITQWADGIAAAVRSLIGR